jgi:hypothetical protein
MEWWYSLGTTRGGSEIQGQKYLLNITNNTALNFSSLNLEGNSIYVNVNIKDAAGNVSDVYSKYISKADIGGNGEVGMSDYGTFVTDYLAAQGGGPVPAKSDLDANGSMSMNDYSQFVQEYLKVLNGSY